MSYAVVSEGTPLLRKLPGPKCMYGRDQKFAWPVGFHCRSPFPIRGLGSSYGSRRNG